MSRSDTEVVAVVVSARAAVPIVLCPANINPRDVKHIDNDQSIYDKRLMLRFLSLIQSFLHD